MKTQLRLRPGILFRLLLPLLRLPDELPVGLETFLVVLGVEGFVERAADLFRKLRVAELSGGV
ncbi:MAG: hypothetical protein ACR2HO_11075 [Rubrobacteraceae bacterium]